MKTKHQITTVIFLMLFIASGFAGTPTLSFFSANGTVLEIPVKQESVFDSIPFDIAQVVAQEQRVERKALIDRQYDIRSLAKPEADVEDVSIDTRAIFLDISMEDTSASK